MTMTFAAEPVTDALRYGSGFTGLAQIRSLIRDAYHNSGLLDQNRAAAACGG
jgi:hypothetical protein